MNKELELEENILKILDLDPAHFQSQDLQISPEKKVHYLTFSKVPKRKDNVLVMLHGYLGTSVVFFKMFKVLMEKFYIVSIDLQGFGLSSREKDTPQNIDDWIQFLTAPVVWVLRGLQIDRFNLLGHSLGAFVAAHLAKQIRNRVQRLFLLSPGGMNLAVNSETKIKERLKKLNFFRRWYMKWAIKKMFKEKKSPVQAPGFRFFRGTIAKRIYGGERLNLTQEQKKLFIPLFKTIFGKKASGDKCVGYVFHYGIQSNRPILPIVEELYDKIPIFLYYGEHDWMDFKDTIQNLKDREIPLQAQFISKADHQIVFQNPYETSMLIIKDFMLSRKIVQRDEKIIDQQKTHLQNQRKSLYECFDTSKKSNPHQNSNVSEMKSQIKEKLIDTKTSRPETQNQKDNEQETPDFTLMTEEEFLALCEKEIEENQSQFDRDNRFDDVRLILRDKFEFRKIPDRENE